MTHQVRQRFCLSFCVGFLTTILLMFFTALPVSAQDGSKEPLSTIVSIDVDDEGLAFVLRVLSRQAGLRRLWMNLDFGMDKVTVHLHDIPLKVALAEVLRGRGLVYLVDRSTLFVNTSMEKIDESSRRLPDL